MISGRWPVSSDGTSVGFRSRGSGPPLLLVHGTSADHTRWAGISSHLEAHFTVHAMDRRGRGGSGDAVDHALLREAEDVAAVIEAIGGPVDVIGHSFGAVCSLEAALLTHDIGRMVLYEPPLGIGESHYPPGVPGRMEELIEAGRAEEALTVFLQEIVRMPERELELYRREPVWPTRVRLAATIPRELRSAAEHVFRAERFSDLTTPTLLLLGGDSPALFREGIVQLGRALPNAEIVELAGQQHIAMDTAPDLFLGTVLDYLRGEDRA